MYRVFYVCTTLTLLLCSITLTRLHAPGGDAARELSKIADKTALVMMGKNPSELPNIKNRANLIKMMRELKSGIEKSITTLNLVAIILQDAGKSTKSINDKKKLAGAVKRKLEQSIDDIQGGKEKGKLLSSQDIEEQISAQKYFNAHIESAQKTLLGNTQTMSKTLQNNGMLHKKGPGGDHITISLIYYIENKKKDVVRSKGASSQTAQSLDKHCKTLTHEKHIDTTKLTQDLATADTLILVTSTSRDPSSTHTVVTTPTDALKVHELRSEITQTKKSLKTQIDMVDKFIKTLYQHQNTANLTQQAEIHRMVLSVCGTKEKLVAAQQQLNKHHQTLMHTTTPSQINIIKQSLKSAQKTVSDGDRALQKHLASYSALSTTNNIDVAQEAKP